MIYRLPFFVSLSLGLLLSSPGQAEAGDWPQWRGIARDGRLRGESFPASLPADLKPVWKKGIGPGFSSPVIAQGILVVLDEQNGKEVAHALRAADGTLLWEKPFAESFADEWGSGPRSTPVIEGDRVYVQSCKGEFACLSMKDGAVLWSKDFTKDYGVVFVGTKVNEGAAVRRGHNGSAVVVGDKIIVPVGSTNGATLVCFEKKTGAESWKSLHDETAYSSPVLATLADTPQVVAFTADALVGVHPGNGALLWRVPIKSDAKRHALSPVIVGHDRVIVASHSAGMLCIQVARTGETYSASVAWQNRSLKINLSTPTAEGNYLFGFTTGQDYACIQASDGAVKWSQPGFGKGVKTDYASTLCDGERLLVLNEAGTLSLIAADPAQYRLLGQLQVCGKTWTHPAYSDGHLYVRDGKSLQCLAIRPSGR